ncbi:leucine-rich repeat extensin-like protein 5 [Ischnura elegans]|uniref:leucine-rich repeat extensin-like protein 5 n=1 Tax=Ischnura elegans TaxID=197161 RepID=UPI001ED8A012|nr:leucine-rich repeat extensin-like protein 5 [Ischnura elegans]
MSTRNAPHHSALHPAFPRKSSGYHPGSNLPCQLHHHRALGKGHHQGSSCTSSPFEGSPGAAGAGDVEGAINGALLPQRRSPVTVDGEFLGIYCFHYCILGVIAASSALTNRTDNGGCEDPDLTVPRWPDGQKGRETAVLHPGRSPPRPLSTPAALHPGRSPPRPLSTPAALHPGRSPPRPLSTPAALHPGRSPPRPLSTPAALHPGRSPPRPLSTPAALHPGRSPPRPLSTPAALHPGRSPPRPFYTPAVLRTSGGKAPADPPPPP